MKKISAKTLEEALIKASIEFNCSVTELEYEISQNASAGFLGFGAKEAIIVVDKKYSTTSPSNAQASQSFSHISQPSHSSQSPQSHSSWPVNNATTKASFSQDIKIDKTQEHHISQESISIKEELTIEQSSQNIQRFKSEDSTLSSIDNGFFMVETIDAKESIKSKNTTPVIQKQSNIQIDISDETLKKIENEIKELFSHLPFKINYFLVEKYNPNTIFIKMDGEDSALLIGEKGYRYNALSYVLFNWLNPIYNCSIRLEIAEFLKNQEENMNKYLENIINAVNTTGSAKTKTLDGILAYIAINKLRDKFPNKYVSFRQNDRDEKYIIINDFKK